MGSGQYDSIKNSPGNNYDSNDALGDAGLPKKVSSGYDSNIGTGNYDAGSNTYGSGTGGHGSSDINAGPRESGMINELESRVDSNLGKTLN